VMWVVWGYEKSSKLKLVATGNGDYKEMTAALCVDTELHYSLMNSPDGVKKGFCEWTGPSLGGMKRAYLVRNVKEIEKLIGFVHHRFKGEEADALNAEIHALKVYEGDKTIGEVKGWNPSIEEWRVLWADVDPVKGWDPSNTWIYRWNPYGLFSLGNLPEEDKLKLKQYAKRIDDVPEEMLPKGLRQKIKQLAEATTDDDIPKFDEEETKTMARIAGMFDLIDIRDGKQDPGKMQKHDPGQIEKTAPPPKKKLVQVEPDPDPPEPEDDDPEPEEEIPEPEEAEPEPEDEEPEPDSDEDDPDQVPDEKKYFIYTTSLGQNAQTASQVYQVKMILDLHKIPYEEVDLYLDGLAGGTRRKEMFAKSNSRVLPQIFINEKYLEGGFDEFMWLNEIGEL